MSKQLANKIIWAADSTQDPRSAQKLVAELQHWSKKLNCEVEPVFVFPEPSFGYSTALMPKTDGSTSMQKMESYNQIVTKSVDRYLAKIHAKQFLPPKLLFTPTLSTRKMATTLATYAERTKAQFIFVNTRASKGWNPLRLGGFAETLMATSQTPVLLMNANALPSTDRSDILFPTNFSRESKRAISTIGILAQQFDSEILLFNQLESPYMYGLPFEDRSKALAANKKIYLNYFQETRQKKARAWSQKLNSENIKCTSTVQRQRKYLAQDIVNFANRKKVGLIGLVNHGGIISQFLIGSVAQDVLLKAKCPVLVFNHPKSVKLATESLPPAGRRPRQYNQIEESTPYF